MREKEFLRKMAQEVEIDHLLAEEFACDPEFCVRFISACGIDAPGFRVESVIAEFSLGGEGFGDLLVTGQAEVGRVALLVEDKVTAGAAHAKRNAMRPIRLGCVQKGGGGSGRFSLLPVATRASMTPMMRSWHSSNWLIFLTIPIRPDSLSGATFSDGRWKRRPSAGSRSRASGSTTSSVGTWMRWQDFRLRKDCSLICLC